MPNSIEGSAMGVALEPNPADDRLLSTEYFTELSDFLLDQMRWGRVVGLLPSGARAAHVLPRLVGSRLELDAIVAAGLAGHVMVSLPQSPGARIEPLELDGLPAGEYVVHACLERHRTPCGEAMMISREDGSGVARTPRHRASRIVLDARPTATAYLDTLPIARVTCDRRAGYLAPTLDAAFHPPIADMAAYQLPNPLVTLAERVVAGLESDSKHALSELLRVESQALRQSSLRGAPQLAFLQAQRCLGLVAVVRLDSLVLPRDLEQREYDPGSFPRFLSDLAQALRTEPSRSALPDILVIDGKRFLRADGEFLPADANWKWTAKQELQATELAVYFPRAVGVTMPHVKFSRHRDAVEDYRAHESASSSSAPGVVMLVPGITGRVEQIFAMVADQTEAIRFTQRLNDGHALYYR